MVDKNNITCEDMLRYEIAYRIGEPKISNKEWDELVEITGYKENIGDACADSANGRKRIAMKTPLASLKKVYNIDKFVIWVKKNFKPGQKVVIEPKLDGNACNVSYQVLDDGTAIRKFIGSSGDGLASMIVFPHALDDVELIGIPERLSVEEVNKFKSNGAVIDGIIEIRGEAIINIEKWEEENPRFKYESWRQMVAAIMCRQSGLSWTTVDKALRKDFKDALSRSGLKRAICSLYHTKDIDLKLVDGEWVTHEVRIKDILPELLEYGSKIKCFKEHLTLVTYSCSTKDGNKDADFLYEIPSLITFKNSRFEDGISYKDICSTRIHTSIEELDLIVEHINRFFSCDNGVGMRHSCNFQCDGLVLKPENEADADMFNTRSGELAHDPSNMIAIKIFPEGVETTILDIYEEITMKGNHTMHAKIEPIRYMGSKIENLNLFNPDWVKERSSWLYVGAKVKITFSGDLIPILVDPTK